MVAQVQTAIANQILQRTLLTHIPAPAVIQTTAQVNTDAVTQNNTAYPSRSTIYFLVTCPSFDRLDLL